MGVRGESVIYVTDLRVGLFSYVGEEVWKFYGIMGLKVVRVRMKKVNLKHVGLGIVFVLLVVGIPLIMDKYIIGNNVPSNIDNSDWVSFLGSYIGAVLGGIFTFIGIKVTLYNSVEKKKQEQVRGVKLPLSQRYRVRPEFCRIEQINTSQVKILVKCFFISLSQSKSFVILSKFQAMWFSSYSTDGYILC